MHGEIIEALETAAATIRSQVDEIVRLHRSIDELRDCRHELIEVQHARASDGWILVNIGCIECGVSTAIVGVFDNRAVAEDLRDNLSRSHSFREGGQNSFEIFPMPARNEVADEYSPAQKS